ncbi:hypothetical protein GCM10027066_28820 [Dyella jejuensis]
MQKQSDSSKHESGDRNESGVADMDHTLQKERNRKTKQGAEEIDQDAKRDMGVEHPGRVVP